LRTPDLWPLWRWLGAACIVAMAAGLARLGLSLIALGLNPEWARHVNAGGVPLAAQVSAAAVCAVTAALVFGAQPLQRLWAAFWALAAGELGGAPLVLAGWPVPSLAVAAWLALAAALVLTVAIVARPAFRDQIRRRRIVVGCGLVAVFALVVAAGLERPPTALQITAWSALGVGALAILEIKERTACSIRTRSLTK